MYKHIVNKCRSSERYSFCFNVEDSAGTSIEDSAEDLCEGSLWNIINEEYKTVFDITFCR